MQFLTHKNRAQKNICQRRSIFSVKKTLSLLSIVFIAVLFGGVLSYVRASYIEPASSAPGSNTPAPILLSDQTGNFSGFRKIGKLGITDSLTKVVDTDEISSNSIAVMGQIGSNGLFAAGNSRIRANLETTSVLFPLFVGDPTDTRINQGKTFDVLGHTRAPRMVVGSKSASADLYNLFVAEGSKATNLGIGKQYFYQGSGSNFGPNCIAGVCSYETRSQNQFCTMTSDDLKNKGCPAQTYLQQVLPSGYGTVPTAVCRYLVDDGSSKHPYSQYNKGSCY